MGNIEKNTDDAYNVICPDCLGDGKETCHNPDHELLSALSFRGANESRCPCCGHDKNYKMKKFINGKWQYKKCCICNGTGKVTLQIYEDYIDEFVLEENQEELDEYCLKDI